MAARWSAPSIDFGLWDADDGMGAGFEFGVHFWPPAPITATALDLERNVMTSPLHPASIENHFYRNIGGEPLTKIVIQLGIPPRDDEHGTPHIAPSPPGWVILAPYLRATVG